jgi:hypothetical protein
MTRASLCHTEGVIPGPMNFFQFGSHYHLVARVIMRCFLSNLVGLLLLGCRRAWYLAKIKISSPRGRRLYRHRIFLGRLKYKFQSRWENSCCYMILRMPLSSKYVSRWRIRHTDNLIALFLFTGCMDTWKRPGQRARCVGPRSCCQKNLERMARPKPESSHMATTQTLSIFGRGQPITELTPTQMTCLDSWSTKDREQLRYAAYHVEIQVWDWLFVLGGPALDICSPQSRRYCCCKCT